MARRFLIRSLLLSACGILFGGCSAFTDPAVRLAYCVERQSKVLDRSGQDRSSAPCNLETAGGFVAVLLPQGPVSEAALIQAGVPATMAAYLRRNRMGDLEEVLVFLLESPLPSNTTYQHRFARIPKLLVIEKSNPEAIVIELVKTGDAIEIAGLR